MKKIFSFILLVTICIQNGYGQWNFNPAINNQVCSQPYDQQDVRIVSDKRSGAIITWADFRNDPAQIKSDIFVQRINSNGINSWLNNGVAVCTNTFDQSAPIMTTDGNGGAIIAWQDLRNGNQDIFVQRVDSSGNIMWTSDGLGIVVKNLRQSSPKIISDGANGAILVWEDSINGNFDIYAQRINSNGIAQWTNGGVVICNSPNNQINPKIAMNSSGEIFITWQDKRNGTDYDIYCQKLNTSGTPQWTTNGIAVIIATNSQLSPKISIDNTGYPIIAWQDKRNGQDYNIYAQRINNSGTIQWGTSGVTVCDASGNQSAIDMTTENITDGVIISWKDARGTNVNIYGQKVDLSGNIVWTTNGILISKQNRTQINPNIIGDNAGGAIVVWQDSLGGIWDVYSQHIAPGGTVLWTSGGVAIATATDNQTGAKNINDGNGNAIYAFQDKRSGDFDVYAYKFAITGGVISSSQTICSGGDPAAFTETSAATGTGLTYQWQSSTDGIVFANNGLPTTPTYNVPAGLTTTTYYRRVATGTANTVTCTANSNTIKINVTALPDAAGAISGFDNACETQTGTQYTTALIPNADSYSWTYSGTGVTMYSETTNTMTMDFSATATSGILTVKGINTCGNGATSPTYSITVNPIPGNAGTITGTSTLCQGTTTVFYSIPAVTNADNYVWNYSGTGALISGSTNSITIDFTANATSGILTVKGGNNCTTGTVSPDFNITVNTIPQGSFTGNSICTGDTRNGQLTWVASSGNGPYSLTYNDGASNRTQANAMSGVAFDAFLQPTGTTTYSLVSVTSNNCSRSSGFDNDIATITVSSQTVSITTNPYDTIICDGSDASFSVSASGAYAYQWQVSTNGGTNYSPILTAGANPTYAHFNTPTLNLSGTSTTNNGYKFKCLITASCGSDITSAPATLTVNPLPAAADTIIGLQRVCQKQNGVIYTVPPVTNATNYVWTYSGTGATLAVSSNTVTINFSATSTSGYLSVTGTTAFCSGLPSPELPITVILSPTSAGLITGTNIVCQNQTAVSYKIPIFHGNHSSIDEPTFTWAYTGSGATISGPTNPMTIDFSDSATSGVLTVMRTQLCGNGQISPNYTITVNPAPAAPDTITGTHTVCQAGLLTYSVTPISNATKYIWTYSDSTVNITDTTNSIAYHFGSSGILTVRAVSNTCSGPESNGYPITGHNDCIIGVKEFDLLNDAFLFPNPTTGIVNIEIKNAQFNNVTIHIIDIIGKEVFNTYDKNISANYSKQINLEGLASGIYYVKIITEIGIKTFKISLQ